MVFSPNFGFRLAVGVLVWTSAALTYAQGTPLSQVLLPNVNGKPTDLLTLLKQQRQLTDDQVAHLSEMTVPYTADARAKIFLEGMGYGDNAFLTAKFTEKLNAMQNERNMGPPPLSSEPPKVVGIITDSGAVDGNVDLPHETSAPLASAKIPKFDPKQANIEESIAYYQNLPEQPEPIETAAAFNLNPGKEESDDQLDEAAMTPPVLGRCAKDNTVRIKNDYRIETGPKGIRFDGLFVDADSALAEKLESDTELALIGADTAFFPYVSEPGDLLSLKAVEYGATCLPFRIRVTDKFIYFHFGEDALKNYDKNPDGNGTPPKSIATGIKQVGGKP